MKIVPVLVALSIGGLFLTGCKIPGLGGDAAPTGQVVATVGDREITSRELDAEMANLKITDPKARKAAEQTALTNIINRVIIARAAKAQDIDKTPDYVLAHRRLEDSLLAQSLERSIASQVPAPSREEVESFISAHPDTFAERKIWTVDQIRMAKPSDPALLKSFEPLNTLSEVEAKLVENHIDYKKGEGNIDAVGADPRLVDAILKLAPGTLFILPAPNGDGLLVNQIRSTQTVPFGGEDAVRYATALLTRERTADAVNRNFGALVAKAQPDVHINKNFAPAPVRAPAKAG